MNDLFRVVAIISAFNEGDVISQVIGHLVENGIDIYLIDNHSTDDTVEQASSWVGRGVLKIESFPQITPSESAVLSPFDWTAILRRKEELASELRADWFIHNDADEIRESPWPGTTLKEAIRWVDTLGYNCIHFKCLNFSPVDDGFKQGDDPRIYFTFYENAEGFDKVRFNCWKKAKTGVSLVPSGGHETLFENRRVFPIQFLLRHYPIRGQRHGVQKIFTERKPRFLESERSKGWHVQYEQFKDETHSFLRDPTALRSFDLDRERLELMLPEQILRNLTDRLMKTDEELDALRSHRAELERYIVSLERGLNEHKQHVANLEREREELRKHAANLERERDELRSHAANLEREITGIRDSRSWRWTAPFRWLSRSSRL